MAASAVQVAQLRRMIAEPSMTTYSDTVLASYIEQYPLLDERGEVPYVWNTATTPPTQTASVAWVPTYDLQAAAADIWDEKAANVADHTDFTADGANISLSQQYAQAQAKARYHRSRRSPRSGTLVKWPAEDSADTLSWIGNLAEPTT